MTLQRLAHWCIFDVNLLPGAIVLNCGMDKNLKMRLSFGTTCFNIHRFVQGEMSVAHTSKLVHAGDESITNHSPYFSVRSWALYGRPLYGQPFWFQIYRVWPVDDFRILLRGRGRFGRGPSSPVTPVIATCIKSGARHLMTLH